MTNDTLYKKSIFGLLVVAVFGIAVFLNTSSDKSALNKKELQSANISEVTKLPNNETAKPVENSPAEGKTR